MYFYSRINFVNDIPFYCLLLYSIFYISFSFSQEEQIHDFLHSLRIRSLTKKKQRGPSHEEHAAVSKIKVDPMHFFRYAKRYSICKQEVGPLLNPLNNTLTDNKYEMCCLLANQFNSVFTKPKQTSVTFFLSHTTREDDLFLTDITLSDS